MLILLSPAKTLDMQTPSRVKEPTIPAFLPESEKLVRTLKRYSRDALGELMHLSDSLAQLNADRYKQWSPQSGDSLARPAIQAFRGDVYVGLDVDTLSKTDLNYAQKHIRMLSGLYGVLRPFDLMQAHRLEMGTALKTRRGESLYEFWGDRITDHLNDELSPGKTQLIVNLASNEYFKSVRRSKLVVPPVSPVFKDEKNGNYKVISFFAKKARGAMARHLIKTRARAPEDILAFSELGYRFDEESSSEAQPVFLRSAKAAEPYLA
ncbi:MAG: peroxide stress protein YaaA [Granulosicoccus sp.]